MQSLLMVYLQSLRPRPFDILFLQFYATVPATVAGAETAKGTATAAGAEAESGIPQQGRQYGEGTANLTVLYKYLCRLWLSVLRKFSQPLRKTSAPPPQQ